MTVKELIEKLMDLKNPDAEVLINHIDDMQVPIANIYGEDRVIYIDDATVDGYKLINRYGDKNYLVPVKDKTYKLICQHNYGVRVGYNEDNGIAFIDPSGGPMLSVGGKLLNLGTITKIYIDHGILLIEFGYDNK